MKSKKMGSKYIIRLDKGEEIVASLKQICAENNIKAGTITGIGATNKATIGLFMPGEKKYFPKDFEGDFEIAPLTGNVSIMDGEVYLHLHVNICDAELKSYGGHLNSAIVSVTFECVIDIIDGIIGRKIDEELKINLMDFQ